MRKKRFEVIEVDGVIVFDESDDYVPGEEFYDELCELEGNEDLNMKYILATEKQREARCSGRSAEIDWFRSSWSFPLSYMSPYFA